MCCFWRKIFRLGFQSYLAYAGWISDCFLFFFRRMLTQNELPLSLNYNEVLRED
jgi:hypothetical protein